MDRFVIYLSIYENHLTLMQSLSVRFLIVKQCSLDLILQYTMIICHNVHIYCLHTLVTYS